MIGSNGTAYHYIGGGGKGGGEGEGKEKRQAG